MEMVKNKTKWRTGIDSSVGIAICYTLGGRVSFPGGGNILLFFIVSRPVLRLTSLLSNGYRRSFLGGKAAGA
jgi:hypothetical protein